MVVWEGMGSRKHGSGGCEVSGGRRYLGRGQTVSPQLVVVEFGQLLPDHVSAELGLDSLSSICPVL
jgi:hypothetical protein